MTTHFNFTVSDEEADTIFGCIRDEITKIKDELAYEISSNENHWHYTRWYHDRVKFLEDIIQKMKNHRL